MRFGHTPTTGSCEERQGDRSGPLVSYLALTLKGHLSLIDASLQRQRRQSALQQLTLVKNGWVEKIRERARELDGEFFPQILTGFFISFLNNPEKAQNNVKTLKVEGKNRRMNQLLSAQ